MFVENGIFSRELPPASERTLSHPEREQVSSPRPVRGYKKDRSQPVAATVSISPDIPHCSLARLLCGLHLTRLLYGSGSTNKQCDKVTGINGDAARFQRKSPGGDETFDGSNVRAQRGEMRPEGKKCFDRDPSRSLTKRRFVFHSNAHLKRNENENVNKCATTRKRSRGGRA
ncbi:hypothetical protein TNCV_3892951 [Trichonephila clavipes]|nr:hypothetical protein TNCV_3892951 [Trichonephila clavipes]